MSFSRDFLTETEKVARTIDADAIEKMAKGLATVRERGGRVFFVGVGGGAGHASHAVCDFRKLAGIECYSPSDNASELTARINDEGWETSYSAWLQASRINKNDAVFVFSVGAGSEDKKVSVNLVNAVNIAKSVGAMVLGIVGRDGGHTAKRGDAVVIVPTVADSRVTPHTEAYQAVVWHLLVSHPDVARSATKWESVVGAAPSATNR